MSVLVGELRPLYAMNDEGPDHRKEVIDTGWRFRADRNFDIPLLIFVSRAMKGYVLSS